MKTTITQRLIYTWLLCITLITAQAQPADTTSLSWFRNAKFGLFLHWGLYSQTAGDWKGHPAQGGEHFMLYERIPLKEYARIADNFNPTEFDARQWAETARKAGMRYVIITAKHHDGFAMYDSELNEWNAVKAGPKKDIIGLLKKAVEKQGMTFCASSHRAEHYFFMNMGRTFDSDVNDERYADFYGPAVYTREFDGEQMSKTTADTYSTGPDKEWLDDWLVRTCELIDNYRPKILYFDWWIHNHAFKPYLKKLAAYYYNRADEWGEEVTINYKHEAFPPTVATFDVERGALTDISPIPWQTDTAIGKYSWGYRKDNEYKSSRKIICDLIDIVSKNGMLLLNVGPRPDGTFTDEEAAVLKEIGEWMKLNGDGIYATTFWKTFGEGRVNNEGGFFKDNKEKNFTPKDFRFTYKNGYIYAFQMRPNGKDAVIKSFKRCPDHNFLINDITLLSTGEKLEYERNKKALIIKATESFKSDKPICFKIKID